MTGGGIIIVAEISQNFHNLDEAKELTRLAQENGADLVKAQLFDGMKLYGKRIPAELNFEQAKELFDYGASIGIEVFYSVFAPEQVEWCERIGVKRYKIAYSQWRNYELWKDLPNVIISAPYKIKGKTTLFCIPHYPTQLNELMLKQRSNFNGFSDHTIGLDAAKIALARGAEIIEKHFCFRHDYGRDAPWGMMPDELRELKDWEIKCKQIL